MRIAALAFGVLAGLVTTLILALGGLDVASATPVDRTAQAIRFFLAVVGNIGFFGAALTLAFPLAGAILLVAGALAWVAAGLLLSAANLALVIPPLLLLLAAIPAFIAHFRSPRESAVEPEILAPLRPSRPVDDEPFDDEPAVEMPSFSEPPPRRGPTFSDAPRARATAFTATNDDGLRDHRDWNPRKKRPVPPRARPTFRRHEVEEEDDSTFSRFALSASSILSFGLYAALAGAALLAIWTLRGNDSDAAVATAEAPVLSAIPGPAPSSEAALSPVLPAAISSEPTPIRTVGAPPAAAAGAAGALAGNGGTATANSGAEPAADSADDAFGDVVMSDNPLMPPRLAEAPGLPFDESAVASIPPAPQPLELEPDTRSAAELVTPLTPTVGPMMPYTMTPQMAALRTAAATGPTIVAMPTATPSGASSPSDAGL